MEDIASSRETYASASYVPPILISIAAIISATTIVVLFHLLFLKYCKRGNQRGNTFSIETMTVGLDKGVLNMIPILFYSLKTRELYRISQNECVICLGKLDKGDLIRWLPSCGHAFHVPCIDDWFRAHSTCPICRSLVGLGRFGITTMPISPPFDRGGLEDTICTSGDAGRSASDSRRAQFSRARSGSLLRHSTKLVLPITGLRPTDLIDVGLKRSLSMDHSCVIIDLQREGERDIASSYYSSSNISSSSSKIDFILSKIYGTNSIRYTDGGSWMLPRSFSGSRTSWGRVTRNGVLPY